MSSLRSWLRKTPQPHSLRIRTEDGEETIVKLSENARHRWTHAAEAVSNARAVVVTCLDSTGAILRSQELQYEDEAPVNEDEKERKRYDQQLRKDRNEMAAVLEANGRQLNTAFRLGAESANKGQEHLVGLVDTLAQHLTSAITSLHNQSVNLANVVSSLGGVEPAPQADQNGAMLTHLLALAAQAKPAESKPPEKKPNGGK